MKIPWNTILNIHSYIFFPAAGFFLVYAIGAALLRGQWFLLAWAIGALALSVLVQFALGAKSE